MWKATGLGSWDDLQFVLAVARLKSFLGAARELNTNQSTIARHIKRLETDLGTKVFDRHVHGMELTPAGQVLLDKAKGMEKVALEISAQLSGVDTEPSGTVKLTVTEGVGYLWLTPAIVDFCDKYKDIDVEIVTNRETIDLLAHETDIAVALERPSNARLVVSRVAKNTLSLFASQRYIERYGLPTQLSELANHEFCDYSPYRTSAIVNRWLSVFLADQRVRFRTNSASVYLAGMRGGAGIGLLPHFYKFTAPDLVQLAIDTDCRTDIWLVSHEETNKTRRTRLLISYLTERFAHDRERWFE